MQGKKHVSQQKVRYNKLFDNIGRSRIFKQMTQNQNNTEVILETHMTRRDIRIQLTSI
jgi:hypothetical protein